MVLDFLHAERPHYQRWIICFALLGLLLISTTFFYYQNILIARNHACRQTITALQKKLHKALAAPAKKVRIAAENKKLSLIKNIAALLPPEINLQSLNISLNQLKIVAHVESITNLTSLLIQLRQSPLLKNVTLSHYSNQKAKITAQLRGAHHEK